jgi:hypothetical protein
MLEDSSSIARPPFFPNVAGQGGHIHFVDQMSQISRLREDLDVEKRRSRLERNRQQFFEPMEPARRVNVIKRNGEDQFAK